MKKEFRIPFFLMMRSLRRGNKWTLALIIFLIAIAFINLVFVASLFNGVIKNANQQIIDAFTGNIYATPLPGDDFIPNADQTLKKIRKTDGVTAASAETILPASLEFNSIKRTWPILAINPDDEKKVLNIADKFSSGSYLDKNDTDQIIIGRQIAGGVGVEMDAFSFKNAKVGDKITLNYGNADYEFTIKGIFYTKFIDTDQKAFITDEALKKINPNYSDQATSIVIKTAETGNESETIKKLESDGVEAKFIDWEDAAGVMASVTESFLSINVLMTSVALLIAAVTIFIVIYIDISSRRQQIGILRAIGIRPYLITANYVLLSAVYSVAGVLLGSGLFFGILVPYFNAHPFVLPIADATLVVNYADFIIRMESIIWVAILTSLIPAFLITRIKILDALRGK
ncbi:MAG: ABC transporter permease [Patescibacteria group bacterium]|jgi:putative ABC transport system permease protein